MRAAISETDRRRAIQVAYNEEHGITASSIVKGISDIDEFLQAEGKTPTGKRRAQRRAKASAEAMSTEELERTASKQANIGHVLDVVPRRLGVSGRVVELAVTGSSGDLVLKGLKIRSFLGLRENLFVIERERDPKGAVASFVFTGKGWGHGVGLCQVGAFGMAKAGARYEQILKHYYSGISLEVRD